MLILLPRLLGPADYGSFGLALGLVTLGSAAFALGGPTVMARFVAAAAPEERAGLARALALGAIRWRAAALGLLAAGVVALVVVAPSRFPPLQTMIVLGAVVLDAAATLAFQIALGLDRAVLWSFRYPVQNLLIVAAVPLLHAVAGATGALIAIALASAAALLLGGWAIRGHLVGPRSRIPTEVSRFAVLQALNGLCAQVLYRGGVVAVALLAGSRVQTGYATIALGVAVAFTYGVWQMFLVALPQLATVAANDVHEAGVQLTRLAAHIVIFLLPATVAGAALAGPMMKLLVGDRFLPAATAFAAALAMVPLAPITGAVGAASAIRLRPGARLAATGAGAATFLVAAFVLVPPLGAAGASAAVLAGTIVSALAGTILFPDLLARRSVIAALAASALVMVIGMVW